MLLSRVSAAPRGGSPTEHFHLTTGRIAIVVSLLTSGTALLRLCPFSSRCLDKEMIGVRADRKEYSRVMTCIEHSRVRFHSRHAMPCCVHGNMQAPCHLASREPWGAKSVHVCTELRASGSCMFSLFGKRISILHPLQAVANQVASRHRKP